jgi:hypothetical protein
MPSSERLACPLQQQPADSLSLGRLLPDTYRPFDRYKKIRTEYGKGEFDFQSKLELDTSLSALDETRIQELVREAIASVRASSESMITELISQLLISDIKFFVLKRKLTED